MRRSEGEEIIISVYFMLVVVKLCASAFGVQSIVELGVFKNWNEVV